ALDDRVTALAADFEAASRADWLALAAKALPRGIESLTGRDADGLCLPALGTAEDAAPLGFIPAPRGGERGWDIRAPVRHPDPAVANRQILEELAGGAASVLVSIDPAAERGVAVGSAKGLARVLDGVMVEVAPVALDAGFLGAPAAQWLAAAAKASPAAPLAFHLDPLSSFAEAGRGPGPIEAHLAAGAELCAGLAETYPRSSLFLAGGRVIHEAGGTPAQELAFAAAAALAYAKALVRAGMPLDAAFARIVLGLSLDTDVPGGIVKLRAARIVWGRITRACGVNVPARIEARTSGRMLTRAGPWTNLVRLTAAAFAGAVAGADAIGVGAFTDAIGLPGPLARRLARNTSLILMEEAHLGRVADPAAGSWSLEARTADLARAAWERFTAIEAAGGAAQALVDGLIAEEVGGARAALAAAIAAKALRIVGVTDFADAAALPVEVDTDGGTAVEAPSPGLPGSDSHCPPLEPVRLEALVS
ncbi:MAG: methylmalonyl-CoA mutase family protein, partial [Pseudomonadota bacterium]